MSKIAAATAALTLAVGSFLSPMPARAENGQIAAGVVGGLIGGAMLVPLGPTFAKKVIGDTNAFSLFITALVTRPPPEATKQEPAKQEQAK